LKSGDIGFAETYIAGDWTTPHLADLLRVFLVNRREVEDVIYGTWAGRLLHRLRHLLNRNTRANSQKNIHAHYDLGNAFYSLWLDGTMNYSSAWFDGNQVQPMQDAQRAKVRRALRMTQVKPGDRVLEIGRPGGIGRARLSGAPDRSHPVHRAAAPCARADGGVQHP
jgi:cyclopropane-fatty-acyl-phospholipid synthase